MSGLRDEGLSQLKPDATFEDRCFDFLGKYTVLLNGTTCEKRADQPTELDADHKREVVEFMKSAILALGLTKKELVYEILNVNEEQLNETIGFMLTEAEAEMFALAIYNATMEKMKGGTNE